MVVDGGGWVDGWMLFCRLFLPSTLRRSILTAGRPGVDGCLFLHYFTFIFPDFASLNSCVLYIPSAMIQHNKPKIA